VKKKRARSGAGAGAGVLASVACAHVCRSTAQSPVASALSTSSSRRRTVTRAARATHLARNGAQSGSESRGSRICAWIQERAPPPKADASSGQPYKPSEHPYTRWAETVEGESQIGVIYSAQGFEFGHIGVIWGRDLVWRNEQWIAQPKESRDRPVRSSPDMLRLVRNAYRVLLTRGLRGARILILDEETRDHVERSLADMQS
jgi:hypothetical protein